MRTMDHFNFSTGNSKMDYFLLGGAWLMASFNWQTVPVILSSIASALVILNQVTIYKNRNKPKTNG